MATTATDSFPIGFRRMGALARVELDPLARWAAESDFAHVDLSGPATIADVAAVGRCGVAVGTVDLVRWGELLSPDTERRRDATAANVERIRELAGAGGTTFFAVAAPEDPTLTRAENFGYAVESYRT